MISGNVDDLEEAAGNPAVEGDNRAGVVRPDDQGEPIVMDQAESEEGLRRSVRSKRRRLPARGDRDEERTVKENR